MYILVKGALIPDVQDSGCKGVRRTKIIEEKVSDGPPRFVRDLFYDSFVEEMRGCGTVWAVVVFEWTIIDLAFQERRNTRPFFVIMDDSGKTIGTYLDYTIEINRT